MGACCSKPTKPITPKQNTKPVDPKKIHDGDYEDQSNPQEKQRDDNEIAARAKLYPITNDTHVKGLPMLDRDLLPPLLELPTAEWLKMVLSLLKEIFVEDLHQALAVRLERLAGFVEKQTLGKVLESEAKEAMGDVQAIFERIFDKQAPKKDAKPGPGNLSEALVFMGMPSVPPKSLAEYDNLFTNPELRPITLHEIDNDFAFTRLRVAGYAPMQMRKMDDATWDLLNLKDYKGHNENTLLADAVEARKEGRLYCTSYAIFGGLQGGNPGNMQKYVVSPIALFQIPKDKDLAARAGVTVMGIQVVAGDLSTTFVPQDDIWAWRYAKLSFNSAESNYHEGICHLGETHLVVEAMALSLHHSLATTHPVYVLMKEHFFGTIFINWAANKALIQPGGGVDNLLAPTIEEVNTLVSKTVLDVLGSDLSYPARMEAAGLTEEQFPCTNYPFREDANKLWKATLKWVTGYINSFYKTDQDIVDDMQLNTLRNNMIALGKITWIEKEWPLGGGTREFVAKMLTSFIFIGSVMHASVNFPQLSMMSPASCVPLATYAAPLTPETATEENVLNALPPLSRAQEQKVVDTLLGGIYYTKLGQYIEGTFPDSVKPLLAEYQNDLATIAKEIEKENVARVAAWEGHDGDVPVEFQKHWAYTTLLPDKVPQSINI